MTEQYYLNNLRDKCVEIPSRNSKYLDKNNCLSEFKNAEEQELARLNLGIPNIVDLINLKIDSKVIQNGGVSWDLEPRLNSGNAINSGNIYNALQKYALRTEVDSRVQDVYQTSLLKIRNTYNKIEDEINLLNLTLREYIDCVKNSSAYVPLESRISNLENLIKSLEITKDGTIISNRLGTDEFTTISLKTITDALNLIWNKIDSITGETTNGITMKVTPSYFTSKSGANVNIEAKSNNSRFEHIAFYANGIIIDEADNVDTFTTSTRIKEDTEITCVATILGVEYTKSETIHKYNGFFIFAGNFNNTDELLNYIEFNADKYLVKLDKLEGYYSVECRRGEQIFMLLEESLAEEFIRADLNGVEIQLNKILVNFKGERYILLSSVNSYNVGTYNIYING